MGLSEDVQMAQMSLGEKAGGSLTLGQICIHSYPYKRALGMRLTRPALKSSKVSGNKDQTLKRDASRTSLCRLQLLPRVLLLLHILHPRRAQALSCSRSRESPEELTNLPLPGFHPQKLLLVQDFF